MRCLFIALPLYNGCTVHRLRADGQVDGILISCEAGKGRADCVLQEFDSNKECCVTLHLVGYT
jgi:hypothetical protein